VFLSCSSELRRVVVSIKVELESSIIIFLLAERVLAGQLKRGWGRVSGLHSILCGFSFLGYLTCSSGC
jgi:hypothetical protein